MSSIPAENAALPAGMSASAFSSVFGAINGLRNRRALIAMMGCLVGGVLLAGLLGAVSTQVGALASVLAVLVWMVAGFTGINAAGLLHMDHARGISPRSTVDALVYGLMCIPKLIALGILLFLVEIAVFIVIALVLLICKIPFLGPLLFTVVFPVSVVVAGVTVLGLFLCMVLSLPAIWQGATIMRALAQTLAIARSRIVETILLLVVVWLIAFAVAMVVFGVIGAGLIPTLGLSATVVGFSGMGGLGSLMGGGMGGLGGMDGMGGASFGGGSGVGHAIAGTIGFAVLWAVVASLVFQVYLLGLCLVYLRVTEGLDLSATEAALRQKLDEARNRANELGDKARAAANRATAPPASAPAPSAPYDPGAMAAGGVAAAAATPFAAAPPPPAYTPPPSPPMAPPALAPAYPPVPTPYPAAPTASTDIDLSFDDIPLAPPSPPSPTPAFSAPAYVPPPAQPPAPVAPAPTTCPQCLSPITGEDVFCGVCGYRVK